MASRNKPLFSFRLRITIMVLLIVATTLSLAFVITMRAMLFVPLGLTLVLALLTVNLIRYIDKSNRDLTHFLLSIRQGAYTESYTSGERGMPHKELSKAMNDIIMEFSRLAVEKELHYQYLQAVNNTLNVGIISFNDEGKVKTINPAAKRLLRIANLSTINDLSRIDNRLHQAVMAARPGQRQLQKVVVADELVYISLFLEEITLQEARVKILLIHNLNSELQDKELEAWEQLLGVMTHEIMNSITPIASLSEASRKILFASEGKQRPHTDLSETNVQDIADSVNTIAQRSKGLLQFVKSYRDYSSGLVPHFEKADVKAVVARIGALMRPEMEKKRVHFDVTLPVTSVNISVDVSMVEQAILNLLKNAMQAVAGKNDARIVLSLSSKTGSRALITVADNGAGIEEDVLPKIFVPFYSTKEKGTGIGLSLTQQIMKVHQGQVRVYTQPGQGTKFILDLPLS
jgi:two-component system, NtrC family, nitrogen regulation sensor histidine kinase NtrY